MSKQQLAEKQISDFFNFNEKETIYINSSSSELATYFSLVINENQASNLKKFVIITEKNLEAENLFQILENVESLKVFLFPTFEHNIYSEILPSEEVLNQRFSVLSSVLKSDQFIFITSFEALLLRGPTTNFFKENCLTIETDLIISQDELSAKLFALGYRNNSNTVNEAGTFNVRGEIFEIYPVNSAPVRILFFDDLIEKISQIDVDTFRTIPDINYKKVFITPTSLAIINRDSLLNLRGNLPTPTINEKEKFNARKLYLEKLSKGEVFSTFPYFSSLFFQPNSDCFFDFFDDSTLFIQTFPDLIEKVNQFKVEQNSNYETYLKRNDLSEEFRLIPSPQIIFEFNMMEKFKQFKKINLCSQEKFDLSFESLTSSINAFLLENNTSFSNPKNNLINFFNNILLENKSIYITVCSKSDSLKQQIEQLLNQHTTKKNKIFFNVSPLELQESYYEIKTNTILISESYFFGKKTKKANYKNSSKNDFFSEQIGALEINDYVVHSEFGIGIYKGLISLEVENQQNDFLLIIFDENDKVYVPVYKLNRVQKFADSSQNVRLTNLRNNKFELAKAKARLSVKELAFDIIKLQAKRKSQHCFAFNSPDESFKDFELQFPFKETNDQIKAIIDIVEDLQKSIPMDRLICGDVGFGKTEVAMRASYLVTHQGKQVAFLVPTTLLAYQHFNTLTKRFEKTAINIEFISRFKSPKEEKLILEKLAQGKIDIIIGTHKLLSDKIKYHDLGLVVVDEEHRFGVSHKEKLKLLKSNVHYLTLTATPIPRTLQLALLGIFDLSLISTAPFTRQTIKNYFVFEDYNVIKEAILFEVARNGQVFFVHNRVQDIEEVQLRLKELVPNVTSIIIHGQLSEKEIESRMLDFYSGKYTILIATTIIESGIDIPNANTLIINKAHTFGLAQLHQIRGRIGRSDRQAYAYFLIPKSKDLTAEANKRIQAIQKYAEIGQGMALANSDLEIRGAGNILGAEQSGNIENIGIELYMQLLDEAINNLNHESHKNFEDIEIQISLSCQISQKYIKNQNEKLKYYKKITSCTSQEQLDNLYDEIEDIYGKIPEQLINLKSLMKIKILLQGLGITSIKVVATKIFIKFNELFLNQNIGIRDQLIKYFIENKKNYTIQPDFSIIFQQKDRSQINLKELMSFAEKLSNVK